MVAVARRTTRRSSALCPHHASCIPSGSTPKKLLRLLLQVTQLLLVVLLWYHLGWLLNLPDTVKQQNNGKMTLQQLAPFPPVCSDSQLDRIRWQLPPDPEDPNRCVGNCWQCGFAIASRHPHASWLHDSYNANENDELSHASTTTPKTVFLGCNRGIDAVGALRMISNDPLIDKGIYQKQFCKGLGGAVCAQAVNQVSLNTARPPNQKAELYCVEAMPANADRIKETVKELGWQDRIKVINAAMVGNPNQTQIAFPDNRNIGLETSSLSQCGQKQHPDGATIHQPCVNVTAYTLDDFMSNYVPHDTTGPIEYLSTDVEGWDYEVLLGANQTLARTLYLEFEYHLVAPWPKYPLKDAIDHLRQKDFVCYWAGVSKLWRITDCFLPHYECHNWANVACVSRKHAKLLQRMEDIFEQTLGSEDRFGAEFLPNNTRS